MALSEAVAGLTAIPGVRTAAQLNAPNPDTPAAPGGTLPVAPPLAGPLPASGLRRGSTVSVTGSAALVLELLADATQAGSWAAIAGMLDLGVAAAAELGVDLDRLALVPDPGPSSSRCSGLWALIDGFDLVVLGPVSPRRIRPQLARRLAGRGRNRGGPAQHHPEARRRRRTQRLQTPLAGHHRRRIRLPAVPQPRRGQPRTRRGRPPANGSAAASQPGRRHRRR